jgi:type IV fimbrial biogenesis protein FimT
MDTQGTHGASPQSRTSAGHRSLRSLGFTMTELLVTVAIIGVVSIMAIPATSGAVSTYRLNSAATNAASAIQTTRYQAIMKGYQYKVTFSQTNKTFQVSSQIPPAASFSNLGSAVPVSASPITLSANTTLLFRPNGSVSATVGTMSFAVSYKGRTKTLTVSNYGSISVQ